MRTTGPRLAALAAAAVLTLTACGSSDPEPGEPTSGSLGAEGTTTAPASASSWPDRPSGGESASSDASSAEASPRSGEPTGSGVGPSSSLPSAGDGQGLSATGRQQKARLEQLAPSVLLAEDLPGDVLVGQQRRAAVDGPFEMNMSLNGVRTEGECRRLIRRIDDFSRPGSAVGFSQYEVDPKAAGALKGPEAFASVVITRRSEDVMAMFGQLPQVCGDVSGPGYTAVFHPVPGVPEAARLDLVTGTDRIVTVMGGVSDGDEHLYAGYMNVEPELAEQMMREQVAAFQARDR